MPKKLCIFILIAPLLMAFQCEDEFEERPLVYNVYKTKVTPGSHFSVNDTIWITGRVSSNAFDESMNDSVFSNSPQKDVFSIYKFFEPNDLSNVRDAINQFTLVFEIGQFSFLPVCENAQIQALPELENNSGLYIYKIGLRPITTGDYVISWQNAIIQNSDRNEFIIDNYPIENNPDQIGFNSCGSLSWRFLNESEKEYYFKVQ
ncbi:hypothetical protein [Ascidiimonas aurantiaca]|uniref:hypothetical protein n=1 Tax=Ascidiimonas aurantiaca TaxID=1685432 RepID=UPI0030ECD0D7